MSNPVDEPEEGEGTTLLTLRQADILVALLLLGLSALVIYDSIRVGSGWTPGIGPGAGYFPFYIALGMGIASFFVLVKAIFSPQPGWSHAFITTTKLGRVMSIMLPSVAFVALIHFLGIYVAAAIYIASFMLIVGRDSILRSLAVGIGVPLALFLMFERWFLVPLPKGPLEAMLGFG